MIFLVGVSVSLSSSSIGMTVAALLEPAFPILKLDFYELAPLSFDLVITFPVAA